MQARVAWRGGNFKIR